jgi:hypothetical protein
MIGEGIEILYLFILGDNLFITDNFTFIFILGVIDMFE